MEQSPSWEIHSFSTCQEIPHSMESIGSFLCSEEPDNGPSELLLMLTPYVDDVIDCHYGFQHNLLCVVRCLVSCK